MSEFTFLQGSEDWWQSITNFGSKPFKLPKGELLITSQPLVDGRLGANATAWIK
jgi:alpha-glucosidase